MTLQEWIDANKLDDVSFGALVGRDRSQIYRIRKGTSRPSDELKAAIARVTDGEVPLETWFDLPAQEQAA